MRLKHEWNREAFKEAARRARGTMEGAVRSAMKELAVQVQRGARAEIARGGLSLRWQRGFRTFVFPRNPDGTLNVTIRGRHQIGYANIFERGGTIPGKPLLWLPLPTAPAKINGKRTTAKAFVESVGPLHSINRPGKPPLLAGFAMRAITGRAATIGQLRTGQRNARHRQARAAFGGRLGKRPVSVPLFVGIRAARIRDRLNVSAVYDRARAQLPAAYSNAMSKVTR